jgi:RNA polymerase sigma-70 factor (ECF subfamily)
MIAGGRFMSAPDRSTRPLQLVPSRVVDDQRQNDADLVLALQRGEPTAAEAIWDRYSPRVHRFLLRSLGRPADDVEDLTQETFLRIFTRASAIRKPAALREFVMAVAIRVLKWELRRRRVRRWVRLSDDGEVPDIVIDGVDQEARQALERCYTILNSLATRERVAFALRYLDEMTMEEVASQLSISLSTAKRLVNRSTALFSAQVGKDADLLGYFTGGGAFDGT